jgi:FAD/FMN-containing dehydrogenase
MLCIRQFEQLKERKMTDSMVRASGSAAKPIPEDIAAALRGKMRGPVALPGEDGYVHGRWRAKEEDAACVAWARRLYDAAAPFASGSVYVNFMPADESDRVEKAYGANYRRLAEIKRRYDPDNLFRMNQNIRPAS